MTTSEKTSDVARALKGQGFEFLNLTSNGWLRFQGNLRALDALHRCEISIDPHFFEIPEIRLLELPKNLPELVPHLGADGDICYIAKGSVVIDIFDPVGQTLACIRQAEQVLEQIFQGKLVADLEEEFFVYWGDSLCLVDVQSPQLGRQKTLIARPGGVFTPVITDDETRTLRKLQLLDWKVEESQLPTYRIRTNAKPRPRTDNWPPKTLKDFLAWQGLLDPRCRKKIEQRLQDKACSNAKCALIVIESPLLTYGVAILFNRPPLKKQAAQRSQNSFRTYLYESKIVEMSVVRIDDRYMAQRNIPGKETLAGKKIALIGCGTIGGYLAEMLIKMGAGTSGGQITLVDPDSLFTHNIGRHRLGFVHLFKKKAVGLVDEINKSAPGVDVRALSVDVKTANLGEIDLLIDATGEEALGHWLCKKYLSVTPMVSVWIEGPGTAIRSLLRTPNTGACFRCLCEANRKGQYSSVNGKPQTLLAGQGCEGLYVPFPATVSVQAASLAAEMTLDWANGKISPALRTKILDSRFQQTTPDCDPPRVEGCAACHS